MKRATKQPTSSLPTMTLAAARAAWWSKQGLAGDGKGSVGAVIARTGWLRTLGGSDVYLAARARKPGMKRAELDAAVDKGELRVVPAARGCIYLVPRAMVADLAAHNAETWLAQTEKELAKVGKTLAVVEALAPAVLAGLAGGPLATDALRKSISAEIPSFGEAGKKVGLSSPLPLALRLLELRGAVERTLEGGRLDNERYLWRATTGALPPSKAPFAAIVDAFLGFAGPATVAQISAWSGRPQRDVKVALETLDAVAVTIPELGEAWLRHADARLEPGKPSGIAALAFEDNYLVNHGGLAAVSDPKHHAIKADIWGSGKPETLGEANHVLSRTIVVDGLIAGFWEIDPRANAAVWHTFEPAPKALAAKIEALVQDTARFLLDEIGHAKTYSLDSMDDVQGRADRVVKLKTKRR